MHSNSAFSGSDTYRDPNRSLYDHAWNRVRQYSGSTVEQGVGMHEANHWHRRAYGGLGELDQMQPAEIGHAAAYEAYRTWIHNSSIYEPLSGDVERQREGLIGLAVAEASRLLQFSNRSMDNYARTAASESAAATASIIFYHNRDRDGGEHRRSRSRSRTRRGSFSGSYDDSYASDPYTSDPYASDRSAMSSNYPRQRSHSRHRSHSTSSRHSPMMQFPGTQMAGSMASNVAPIPIPSGVPGGYSSSATYGTPYGGGVPMQIHGQNSPYNSNVGMPMAVSQSYGAAPMALPMGHRQRSTSMSVPYTQVQYPQVQYAQGGQYMIPRSMGAAQPQTIILTGSGHRKHRKKSKRSRSIDRYTSSRY